MRVTHIMSDGSVRESVEGITIPNKEFYIILNELRSKRNERDINKNLPYNHRH